MTERALLRRGAMLPDFVLLGADGAVVRLETYRGRRNVVLVCFGDDGPAARSVALLLDALAALKDELDAETAQVLAVVASPPAESRDRGRWPFPVLVDRDARLHRCIGATDATGRLVAAVLVTDRFREVYAICAATIGSAVLDAQEVINWLQFINIQCPECGVPEWPAQ